MLKEITIQNFAIIESLDLCFGEGFNVFTGETGAGKSIILDAVSIVLGDKADPSFIREGSKRASIEAVFDYGSRKEEIYKRLEEEDLLPDDENSEEITLLREIRSEGRSVSRINGHSVNMALLGEIGGLLVDIHGQSEHLSLLRPVTHIRLVDEFAGNGELLKKYRSIFKKYNAASKRLNELRMDEQDALRQQDILSFQVNEIESAALDPEEEDRLKDERSRMANSEKTNKIAYQCMLSLEGRSDEQPGILEQMGILEKNLDRLSEYEGSMSSLSETVITLSDQLNDILDSVQRFRRSLKYDPKRLNAIEERLDTINLLKRKYGGTVSAVIAFGAKAREKLDLITGAGEETESLETEIAALKEELSKLARQLSEKRQKAALIISSGIERELADLRMDKARFEVRFTHEPDPEGLMDAEGKTLKFSEDGLDKIEFLIAPNPGEGFKPLAKVASGGETSRLMLALKGTLANVDTVPTMIFDEIDQGIGGRIGGIVGEKLWNLSRNHQVICITHLPQLAAMEDIHFHVSKQITENRTHSVVTRLEGEESIHELACLLGGDSEENVAAVHAMLAEAAQYKKK